jgi:cyanophycin synthetase
MEILEIKVLRGPNCWSAYRKHVIDMKLDLQQYESLPTNKIPGFRERLEKLIPQLYEHRCSKDYPGGFLERLGEGTWMGHVIEHVALELQCLAGMPCGYGRTRSADRRGVYHVVFSYSIESAGVYAAKAAVNIARAVAEDLPYTIEEDIEALRIIRRKEGLGLSTQALVNEAKRRGIPYRRLDNESTVMLGYGKQRKTINATETSCTSNMAVEKADDKQATRKMLEEACIPIAKGQVANSVEALKAAIDTIGFPLVIKPLNANHGRGVTTRIRTAEDALQAYERAAAISTPVLVEKFIEGSDFRFLVIRYKAAAVAKRLPAMITGDGKHSIKELVELKNAEPGRGMEHEDILTNIQIDDLTLTILKRKNLTVDSIPGEGEILLLKDTANLSSGGTARDVTDLVHPENIFIAERTARMMGLDICGIDVIAKDISIPFSEQEAVVLEVNACPGFRMHLSPSRGLARNVAEPVIDMLFPNGSNGRIPVVAVTGTNGKTTTTRLIAHIAATAGYMPGYTTTDGIYIGKHTISEGDCSGPSSAQMVLSDPIVDFAVLECARGGILRSGLGFDHCDTSIITNITADHLGLNEIDTLEGMAKVKAVVAQSTFDSGYAILNADDDLVYSLRRRLDCNIALWSMDPNSTRIQKHIDRGGLAMLVEQGYFVLCREGWKTRVARIKEIPLTLDGRAESMIKNIMPAVLAAFVHDISVEQIRQGLKTFYPTPDTTPGRMNIFRFPNFEFMLDYGHNPDGFLMMKKFLEKTNASEKTGIIGCPGDRRDSDIIAMGSLAAEMFDNIIIRHDNENRGRSNESITDLIMKGIEKKRPGMPIAIVSGETDAIQYAIDHAEDNSFIVLFSEEVGESIQYLHAAMEASVSVSRF